MGIKALKIREDIQKGIDPAPKLGEVLSGKADKVYTDAKEFFRRTYFSQNLIDLLKRVVRAIKGEESSRIIILYSFYGGGKTHSILTIYHAFKNPDALKDEEVLRDYDEAIKQEICKLADEIKEISKDLKVIIATGDDTRFFGHPTEPIDMPPYKIHTLWGYIAHNLGKYGLVENYDKNLSIPPQNKINDLLSGEKAIFIIDELIDYAHSMIHSKNEYEKGYVKSLPQFIEYFAKAIRASDSILIISLPVELKEIWFETDWRYDKGFVQSVWNALKDFAFPISPLRTEGAKDDVVEVLKKRIFEKIPENIKMSALQKLREKAVSYEEHFVGYEDFLKKFEKTYPFHPDYLEILEKLISSLKLQKTRDALKITIEVVKSIINSGEDPEYITVWHINPSLDSLKPMLFRDPYADYEMVYRKEIEGISGFTEPELVKITLRTVFLSTYIYDSPIRRDDFPDRKKLVRMVYEPRKFTENNWEPTDVLSALEAAYSSEEITHLMESEGRYWFWRHANVKEHIEKRARTLLEQDDDRIYDKIEEYLKLSEQGKLSDRGVTKKKGREDIVQFFDKIIYLKTIYDERKVEDNRSLKLVVFVKKDLMIDLRKDIFENYEDSERTYKNTVVVLMPSEEYYDKIKIQAARLVACDLVEKEVSSFYAEHGESVVKAQKALIEDFRRTYEKDLIEAIVKGYTLVYYPREVDYKFDVRETLIQNPSYHFPTAVYITLSKAPILKISDVLTFEALVKHIKDVMGVDITESDRIYTVEQIIDWFKQRAAFPMVKDEVIKNALKEGVKLKKIGVLDGNEIYFKKVHKNTLPLSQEIDEGEMPGTLKDDAKVLPWRKAVETQYSMLKESEKVLRRLDVVEKIWYEIIAEDSVLRLEELPTMDGWHYIFVNGLIVEKREKLKSGITVEVYPGTRMVEDAGKEVRITIKAIPINLEVEKAEVSVKCNDKEILSQEMERKDDGFESVLYINAPKVEGEKDNYIAVVKAHTPDGVFEKSIRFTIEARVKRKVVRLREINEKHIGAKLIEISDIKDYSILSDIENIPEFKEAKVTGDLIVKVDAGEINVNYRNVSIDVAANSSKEIADYGLESSGTFRAVPNEPFELKELTVRKLMRLNGKVEFLLELEE